MTTTTEHKLYAIKSAEGKYFKGYDANVGAAMFVNDPLEAKLFNNKYEVRLRPTESIVELTITLSADNTVISAPFRPRLRQKDLEKSAA